jgi:hypothetical protein
VPPRFRCTGLCKVFHSIFVRSGFTSLRAALPFASLKQFCTFCVVLLCAVVTAALTAPGGSQGTVQLSVELSGLLRPDCADVRVRRQLADGRLAEEELPHAVHPGTCRNGQARVWFALPASSPVDTVAAIMFADAQLAPRQDPAGVFNEFDDFSSADTAGFLFYMRPGAFNFTGSQLLVFGTPPSDAVVTRRTRSYQAAERVSSLTFEWAAAHVCCLLPADGVRIRRRALVLATPARRLLAAIRAAFNAAVCDVGFCRGQADAHGQLQLRRRARGFTARALLADGGTHACRRCAAVGSVRRAGHSV